MTAALHIQSPGLLTSLQDRGRPGYQRFGIPVSGALDPVSLAAANLLVGNAAEAAALEVAYQGPTFTVEAESVRIAYAGGEAIIEVRSSDEPRAERLPTFHSARLARGQTVRIGALSGSAVGYLAVEGGFDIQPILGSLSTYARAHLGGWQGRALAAGDKLPLKYASVDERDELVLPGLDLRPPARYRVVLGPQETYFTERGIQTFLDSEFTVSQASDRMGMRLDGPKLEHARGFNIVSDGIAPGSIQVPGTGLPIVLLADRQTTGGYPKLATVISADLPALGRLAPGAKVSFAAIGIEEAEDARAALARFMADLAGLIVPAVRARAIDETKLMAFNLVSGVVDGCAPHDWSLHHDGATTQRTSVE